jgi:hypothetical protein
LNSGSFTGTSPALQRRTSNAGPTLYDFGKTDRRPSQSGSRPMPAGRAKSNSISSKVPASLPVRTSRLPPQGEEFGFDLQFRGSDDDERSGSGEVDGDEMDIDGDESNPLALGTGSGGVKGRRRGQKFNCEICGKVSPLFLLPQITGQSLTCRTTCTLDALVNIDGNILLNGKIPPQSTCRNINKSPLWKQPSFSPLALLYPKIDPYGQVSLVPTRADFDLQQAQTLLHSPHHLYGNHHHSERPCKREQVKNVERPLDPIQLLPQWAQEMFTLHQMPCPLVPLALGFAITTPNPNLNLKYKFNDNLPLVLAPLELQEHHHSQNLPDTHLPYPTWQAYTSPERPHHPATESLQSQIEVTRYLSNLELE